VTANNHSLDRGKSGLERTIQLIDSLFACDREVQDKERSKIIRNKLCFIDKWLSCQLRVYIDVGTTRMPDATKKSGFKLTGDVKFDEVAPKCSILSVAERLSDRVSMIESLFACDREVQDKERSKIIRFS